MSYYRLSQQPVTMPVFNGPAHGSPEDRGSMDYYYGRQPRPHKWIRTITPDGAVYKEFLLTDPQEIADYHRGFEEETERKEW